MLTASNLTCTRGERPLFAGLSLALNAGEWLHVRGANGTGKTSLLRLLAGLSQPEAGEVCWQGEPIGRCAPEYRADMQYLGHHAAVKEDLTGTENLTLAAELDGRPLGEAAATAALRQFGLRGREDLPVRNLSAGQKRRVLLARLVTRQAKLWILDEPFTALDTRAIDLLGSLIGSHLAAGGMAVVTSHQQVPIAGGTAVQL